MKIRKLTVIAAILLCTALFAGCSSSYNFDIGEYASLGRFEGIEVSKATIEEQLEATVDNFLQSNATTAAVERAAKDGDIVNINYVGTIDGVAFEGGTADNQNVTLGAGGMIDGFEEGLMGTKAGETVTLNLTFPEDYHSAEHAGKDAVFTVTVNTVSEMTVPELTDALISEKTNYATVDEYKADKRQIIKQNLAWEEVLADAKINKYPEKEVKKYYDTMIQSYEMYASMYGVTLDAYVYQMTGGLDMDTFTAQIISTCKTYCANDMLSRLVCEQKGIEMTNADYDRIAAMFAEENGMESVKALEESAGKDAIENNVILQLAVEYVGSSAVEVE